MTAINLFPDADLPFSDAQEVGGLVFLAGKIGLGSEGKVIEGTIEEETHQTMKNIKKVLDELGLEFKNIVKTEIYVTDLADMPKISSAYISYMTKPYPARMGIQVSALPLGARVEIVMIASR